MLGKVSWANTRLARPSPPCYLTATLFFLILPLPTRSMPLQPTVNGMRLVSLPIGRLDRWSKVQSSGSWAAGQSRVGMVSVVGCLLLELVTDPRERARRHPSPSPQATKPFNAMGSQCLLLSINDDRHTAAARAINLCSPSILVYVAGSMYATMYPIVSLSLSRLCSPRHRDGVEAINQSINQSIDSWVVVVVEAWYIKSTLTATYLD